MCDLNPETVARYLNDRHERIANGFTGCPQGTEDPVDAYGDLQVSAIGAAVVADARWHYGHVGGDYGTHQDAFNERRAMWLASGFVSSAFGGAS